MCIPLFPIILYVSSLVLKIVYNDVFDRSIASHNKCEEREIYLSHQTLCGQPSRVGGGGVSVEWYCMVS
jgi:hypothetical protein